ncbi:MAG: serine hydrolase domain-containing protein [Pseudomonadota bacterium]
MRNPTVSKILIFAFVLTLSTTLMFNFAFLARGEPLPEPNVVRIGKGAVDELHLKMLSYQQRQHITNISFGVWQDGALVTEGDYGPVSETFAEPVTDTTIYRIRSMTKPITAIGLLILMERGHFDLSDPITKFLPEFEDTEVIADYDASGQLYTYKWLYPPTMKQLLSHTAGFAYYHPKGGVIEQRLNAMNIAESPNTDALVRTMATVPYVSMPGAEWHYSLSSDLQGAIIERITGQTLSAFLKQEIFDPLNMKDTGFHVAASETHRLSGVSRIVDDKAEYIALEAADTVTQSQIYDEGGHGLYSTRADYLKFLDMLRNRGRVGRHQLISPDTLDRFNTNAIRYRGGEGRQRSHGQGAGLGFGLGIGTVENPTIANLAAPKGTTYWTGALGTWFWVDPVNDIVFIGMIQNDGVIEPDIMKSAMAAIYGEPTPSIEISDQHSR